MLMERVISYAQNGEDIILSRVFGQRESGFYIDIGASHPSRLSVTKFFYDRGWNGINIEPIKKNYALFVEERPRDINLNIAISNFSGRKVFYEIESYPELSTFSEDQAAKLKLEGYSVASYPVEVETCDRVFDEYVKVGVDFLKIDVEGHELEVIKSIDFKKYRPLILVVEATLPDSEFPGWEHIDLVTNHDKWEKYLLSADYIFAYFDGLNRFYLRAEDKDLLVYFRCGLCCHDNYIRYDDFNRLSELQYHADERMRQIVELTKLLKESEADRAARLELIHELTRQLKNRK